MRKVAFLWLLVGWFALPRAQAATELMRHEHGLMSRTEAGVNFWIYGICDIQLETNEQGSVIDATLYYTGGVFANYTHGGASGKADEVITHCDSFIRENNPAEAMWIYDYDFGRYDSRCSRAKGSGTGLFNVNQHFLLRTLFLY